MLTVEEGEKLDVIVDVDRVQGTGAVPATSPQRRILDSAKAVVTGYDWAAATWDAVNEQLYCLFDSSLTGLSTPGAYYVQLRCTLGAEVRQKTVTVKVIESGP